MLSVERRGVPGCSGVFARKRTLSEGQQPLVTCLDLTHCDPAGQQSHPPFQTGGLTLLFLG